MCCHCLILLVALASEKYDIFPHLSLRVDAFPNVSTTLLSTPLALYLHLSLSLCSHYLYPSRSLHLSLSLSLSLCSLAHVLLSSTSTPSHVLQSSLSLPLPPSAGPSLPPSRLPPAASPVGVPEITAQLGLLQEESSIMALPVLKVSALCSLVLSLIVALPLNSPAHRVPCQPKFEGPPAAPVLRSLQSMASASGGDVPDHFSEITLSPSPRFSEISRSPMPAFSECSDTPPSDNEAPPEQEKI